VIAWTEPLELEIPDLFLYEPRPEFPSIEPPETGARIRLVELEYDGELLSFRVLITFSVTSWLLDSLRRLEAAFVMSLENAATGQAVAMNLVDPHKQYELSEGPNFQPRKEPAELDGGDVGGYIEFPVELDAQPPPFEGPSLFVSVSLFSSCSNVVGVDLREVRAISYLDGEPWDPPLMADEDADVIDDEGGEEGA